MKKSTLIPWVLLFTVLAVATVHAAKPPMNWWDSAIAQNDQRLLNDGREIFRFDTFGDEAFWSDTLKLNQVIEGQKNGGVGPGVSPATALAVGLKVDMDALPSDLVERIKHNQVDLNDPTTTLALLQQNAVVGVVAHLNDDGTRINSLGLTCAVCHANVDDAFAPGIGHRLDGWNNSDLNVGAIISLSPNLTPVENLLGVDEATLKKVLASWGPGKFDAEVFLDGKAFRPDGGSAATLIPPAFGLAGVNQHTWTGGWGTVTYWNAFVANLEMHGQGRFYDPRLNNAAQYPIAANNNMGNVLRSPDQDLITSKLASLHVYQLDIPTPRPEAGTFDAAAAGRGQAIFNTKANCATCHVSPIFTEPGWNEHKPSEIGIDSFQADRSPDKTYRTTPLRALGNTKIHKRGFYHDGRFSTLIDVVNHYNSFFNLGLTPSEINDLIEYLKSI